MESSQMYAQGGTQTEASLTSARRAIQRCSTLPVFTGDTLAISIALLAIFPSFFNELTAGTPRITPWAHMSFIFVAWLFALAITGSYAPRTSRTAFEPFKRVARTSLITLGAFAIVDVVFLNALPPALFYFTLPLGILLIFAFRLVTHRISNKRAGNKETYVVLGEDGKDDPALALLTGSFHGDVDISGHIYTPAALAAPSPIDYVLQEVRNSDAGGLLLSPNSGLSLTQIQSLRWALEAANKKMSFLLPVHGVAAQRMQIQAGIGPTIVDLAPAQYSGWYFQTKRLLDVVLAGFGIFLLTPLLLVISLIVKLGDGGPVFFTQVRVGMNGKKFTMYKFRTMRIDAEEALKDMLARMEMPQDSGNKVLFKLKDDPRITKVGGFLRQYSLDELPQLFNAFRGDMTLIGPRPPLPKEVAGYEKHVLRKFMVKPGLTGLWQTMGRSNLSWEDSVYLDLYYAENCSPRLDLKILLRTFKAVLSKDGAF
ncbi:putative sugar transferase EpsL [Corynebacterium atrinae]|uniref:sugar transferase n=1 Tax=Corynebacterium atrinae TaxID=1336740 RepID=UPI0025B5503C|nr:sugar transferase [Corynebacterium atrinae]WJY62521.1 putative sugar transferase EpsL [Corynebacterium atrinae]